MKSNRVFNNVIISMLFFLLLIVGINIALPNFERVSIADIMPELKKGNTAFIVDGNISTSELAPIVYNENILLPTDLIKMYIDQDIFQNDPYIIMVKDDKYIKIQKNEKTYYENYSEKKFDISPIYKDGEMYIPINNFEKLYGITFNYVDERNILIMNDEKINKTYATVIKESVLRQTESYKAKIVDDLQENEKVTIYKINDKWSYAMKANGSMGYIRNTLYYIDREYVYLPKEKKIDSMYDKKVNLLWYQISSKDKNPKIDTLNKIDSLTVVSPTWFEMIKSDGTIREKIDSNFVKWAHQNEYEVWALITNSFGNKELSHAVLSNVEAREKVIKEIVRLSLENNIDGINVDIESISKETGPYFVQFMKELSVFTHINKLKLSADMYMPTEYTSFYNREKIGEIVDYYCLMAYDEHWRTSSESGSVASLPWVENGVRKTLEVVPNHKVLLGIPSYTRRWGEKSGVIVDVVALGMEASRKDLEENNAKITYFEDIGQNYGEYNKNGIRYKIWLEDETSLKKRLEIAEEHNLGGTATWKKGFEKESIWQLYKEYMEK